MPDDLSGWGYCSDCHAVHDRDEDGYVCSDPRPLPTAAVAPGIGLGRRLWRWLTQARSRR